MFNSKTLSFLNIYFFYCLSRCDFCGDLLSSLYFSIIKNVNQIFTSISGGCTKCAGFKSSFTCGCGAPVKEHTMIVETGEEREARGHPLGESTPYAAMGGITGFSSLADGYQRLDPSGKGKLFTSSRVIRCVREVGIRIRRVIHHTPNLHFSFKMISFSVYGIKCL